MLLVATHAAGHLPWPHSLAACGNCPLATPTTARDIVLLTAATSFSHSWCHHHALLALPPLQPRLPLSPPAATAANTLLVATAAFAHRGMHVPVVAVVSSLASVITSRTRFNVTASCISSIPLLLHQKFLSRC